MDIQISIETNGDIQIHQGQEELEMELSMDLAVECLERVSGEVYLIEMVDGAMVAKPAAQACN